MARYLSELGTERKLPGAIACDNDTEMTSKAMFFWSKETGVKLNFIQTRMFLWKALMANFMTTASTSIGSRT
jgi:hypothetical protein